MLRDLKSYKTTGNETINVSVLITDRKHVAQGIIKSLKLANQISKAVKYRIIATDMSVQAAWSI